MPYSTSLQVLEQFGANEVSLLAAAEFPSVDETLLRLTVTEGDRAAYSAQDIADADQALLNITNAISSAERLIDSYISPKYPLPLEQTLIDESSLPEKCNDIVRYKLSNDFAKEEVEKRYLEAMRWLRDVSMGKASLGSLDTSVASPQGRMVSRPGNSKTDWGTY